MPISARCPWPLRSLIFWPLKADDEAWEAMKTRGEFLRAPITTALKSSLILLQIFLRLVERTLCKIKGNSNLQAFSWPAGLSRGLFNHRLYAGNDLYSHLKRIVAPFKRYSKSIGTLKIFIHRQALEYATRCSMKPGLLIWNGNGSSMQLNVSDLGLENLGKTTTGSPMKGSTLEGA